MKTELSLFVLKDWNISSQFLGKSGIIWNRLNVFMVQNLVTFKEGLSVIEGGF